MTQAPGPLLTREIVMRVASAAVLIPVGLGAVALGGVVLKIVTAACGAAAAAEWTRMATRGTGRPGVWMLYVATALGACAATAVGALGLGPLALVSLGGAAIIFVLARLTGHDAGHMAIGALYVSLPFGAFVWIREAVPDGRAMLFGVLAIVWASDIAAYFAGRGFGGPRLAPRESPNKTWTGAIGAVVCSGLVGLTIARITGADAFHWLTTGVILSVIAQSGDLLESRFKRMFGVKDSSGLVPGHGGVLDRLDALMAAVTAAAVVFWLAPQFAPAISPGAGG